MDLSKAFDCLPHDLMLAKFKAYGLLEKAVELLKSYVENRTQRLKLGSNTSKWEDIFKGVPQGSILGPLMFNVFINNMFYFVHNSDLYNYADDNTLSYEHTDCSTLKSVLEKDSETLIKWFDDNSMKANPDTFQAICIGKKAKENIPSFQIGNTEIVCEENVTLLGVNLDYLLRFDVKRRRDSWQS
jgi:ribonuclease P/MRP protein subunit RPP40